MKDAGQRREGLGILNVHLLDKCIQHSMNFLTIRGEVVQLSLIKIANSLAEIEM